MTHLPKISKEQALAVLLNSEDLQPGPVSRTSLLEAVIGIGKNNHAIIAIGQEDLDALQLLTAENQPTAETRPNVHSMNTGRTGQTKPGSFDPRTADQQKDLQAMIDELQAMVRSGRARGMAVVVDLDEDETYTDFYAPFNMALLGGVSYLQHRMNEN